MTAHIEQTLPARNRRFTRLLSAAPFRKLSRFGTIGAFNTATYAILSSGLIRFFTLNPMLSSAVAFAACVPLAFWSHKMISFRSHHDSRKEFLKFAAVQLIGFCVALIDMYACVNLLGLQPAVAIVVTIFVVPILSFVVMDRWVFKTATAGR